MVYYQACIRTNAHAADIKNTDNPKFASIVPAMVQSTTRNPSTPYVISAMVLEPCIAANIRIIPHSNTRQVKSNFVGRLARSSSLAHSAKCACAMEEVLPQKMSVSMHATQMKSQSALVTSIQ